MAIIKQMYSMTCFSCCISYSGSVKIERILVLFCKLFVYYNNDWKGKKWKQQVGIIYLLTVVKSLKYCAFVCSACMKKEKKNFYLNFITGSDYWLTSSNYHQWQGLVISILWRCYAVCLKTNNVWCVWYAIMILVFKMLCSVAYPRLIFFSFSSGVLFVFVAFLVFCLVIPLSALSKYIKARIDAELIFIQFCIWNPISSCCFLFFFQSG